MTAPTPLAWPSRLTPTAIGFISHQEYNAANDGGGLFSFIFEPSRLGRAAVLRPPTSPWTQQP